MLRNLFFVLMICLSSLVGCGERNSIDAQFVEGIVTFDGVPTDGISVRFAPIATDGQSGAGITDVKGSYTVTSGSAIPGSGLLAGEYNVTFSKTKSATEGMSREEYMKKYANSRPKPIYIVPEKYGDVETSGIEPITVVKGKKNKFDFDLKTK